MPRSRGRSALGFECRGAILYWRGDGDALYLSAADARDDCLAVPDSPNDVDHFDHIRVAGTGRGRFRGSGEKMDMDQRNCGLRFFAYIGIGPRQRGGNTRDTIVVPVSDISK